MRHAIVVEGLSKAYRRYSPLRPSTIQEAVARGMQRMSSVERFWALRGVTFHVEAGTTLGVIGGNGSGKSTLLRLLGGVGRPDEGRLEINGRIGALLDLSAGFHPDLTGRENALMAGVLNGLTRRDVLDRLDEIVAFAEIEQFIDNPVRTFSTGMQMRLAFSTAIHTEPDILLIDEVLSVGDVAFQSKCLDRIAAFKATGCSIVVVSHDTAVIESLCDAAVWLKHGRLMLEGSPSDLVRHYIEDMNVPRPEAVAASHLEITD